MGSHTRLVGILSVVQGASLPIFLNFDPKFKGSENIRFTYPHGRVDSYRSMVYRTFLAFVGSRIGYGGCYCLDLKFS